MGMPSVLRYLHQTLSNRKPARPGPSCCVQQPQTLSFRFNYDVYTRFNSAYHDGNDDDTCSDDDPKDRDTARHKLRLVPLRHQPEHASSFDSSGEPSSSRADSWPDSALPEGLLISGGLSSDRFFFCPSTTDSILEEGKRNQTDDRDGTSSVAATGLFEISNGNESDQGIDSFEVSVKIMTMNSSHPYLDFRTSMEEMIEVRCLRDWPQLQNLLHCYLQLNDKQTHRIIVRAFIDIIMKILDDTKD